MSISSNANVYTSNSKFLSLRFLKVLFLVFFLLLKEIISLRRFSTGVR